MTRPRPVPGGPVPVAVLFGGPSAEHDVSIVSGTAIAEALAAAGHPVSEHLIDLDGRWWALPTGHVRGDRPAAAYDDPAALGATGPRLAGEALAALAAADTPPVVFIGLHGPFGEDGTVQALLDADELAFTGSGVAASAVGMDKAFFKRVARGVGLPVLPWLDVRAERWAVDRAGILSEIDAFATATPEGRVIVKPARLGSSVGMSIAWTAADRGPALDLAFGFDARAIVEPCLATPRELEVAVIGNDAAALEVHGPGEVIPSRDFYDYVDKYVADAALTLARARPARRPVRDVPTDRGRGVCRHRRGGLRAGRLPARPGDGRALPQRDQHDPGLHADQPLPQDGGGRRARLRAALRADRRPRRRAPRDSGAAPPGIRGPAPMSGAIPVRGTGQARRRAQRRRSARLLSPGRAAAALVMIASAGAIWGVAASPVFGVHRVDVTGSAMTDQVALGAALDLGSAAPNVFALGTDGLRARLAALPAVASADVSVALPGVVRVHIVEREPVLAWRVGAALLLVDRSGVVIADATAPDATDAARALAGTLPVVIDRRPVAGVTADGSRQVHRDLSVGASMDPADLDVATRLLPLVPADVGSRAAGLVVSVDETDGWLLSPAGQATWTAVLGFYGADLRTVDLVPSQVRLLRSILLDQGEGHLRRIVLASEDAGTYTTR